MKTKFCLSLALLSSLTVACSDTELGRSAERKAIEVMGAMAQKRMAEGGHGGFHSIPIAVDSL